MRFKKYFLTKEGLEKLNTEHQKLRDEKRPEALQRLKEARDMGNLDDNAEYVAAQEELALLEKRIDELEEILKNYVIIEEKSEDFVVIGSTVVVEFDGEIDEFTVVGSFEADPAKGKISNESPVGQALLGAKVGDVVEVTTPIVKSIYKILEIK